MFSLRNLVFFFRRRWYLAHEIKRDLAPVIGYDERRNAFFQYSLRKRGNVSRAWRLMMDVDRTMTTLIHRILDERPARDEEEEKEKIDEVNLRRNIYERCVDKNDGKRLTLRFREGIPAFGFKRFFIDDNTGEIVISLRRKGTAGNSDDKEDEFIDLNTLRFTAIMGLSVIGSRSDAFGKRTTENSAYHESEMYCRTLLFILRLARDMDMWTTPID
jgi:hypothetical protein